MYIQRSRTDELVFDKALPLILKIYDYHEGENDTVRDDQKIELGIAHLLH